MNSIDIQYTFIFPDKTREIIDLRLDKQTLELQNNTPEHLPEWTDLAFHQCFNCPLAVSATPVCPLAANLVNIVNNFEKMVSYDSVIVEIKTGQRFMKQETTVQTGVSALMGLISATSGCPHTAYFRPMARFHLPMASEEETIYRATSMYLLAQFFLKMDGQHVDFDMHGLTKIYANLHEVNLAMAERLRAASKTDSSVNAIVLLDMYAKAMPYVIDESLEELRYLFTPFLEKKSPLHNQ